MLNWQTLKTRSRRDRRSQQCLLWCMFSDSHDTPLPWPTSLDSITSCPYPVASGQVFPKEIPTGDWGRRGGRRTERSVSSVTRLPSHLAVVSIDVFLCLRHSSCETHSIPVLVEFWQLLSSLAFSGLGYPLEPPYCCQPWDASSSLAGFP